MANKKISELESRASLSLSDLMAVGDPSTGYLYKTTISDLKTLTGAGVVSFNGRFGTVNPAEGDYTLTQLGDVIITSPSNGQVLKYNGSNWVNATEVAEADTLDTVTGRGNTTANSITVGSVTAAGLSNLLGQIRTFATTGNTYIGANPVSATDAGYKVDINGTLRVQGRIVTGLGGIVNNCLYTYIGNHCGSSGFLGFGFVNTGDPGLGDSVFDIFQSPSAAATYPLFHFKHTAADSTGGSNALNIVAISTTVNQTSGSNGVVRGFYYNPTLTSINGSHYAFESTSGKIKVSDLGGTGSRMVVADANGVLSTQAIPTSAVTSVFGRTGAVVAASGDYTTTQVTEGTNLYYTDARARAAITLTTTGSSGAATYNSTTGVFNIPTYTLAGLGGQPALNGTGFVKISGTTISYDNSSYVTIDTAQTITGAKTFTNIATFNQNIVGGLIKLSQGVLLSKSANIGSDPGFLSLIATSSTGLNTINIADGDNTSFTQKLIVPNGGNYNYTFPTSSGTLALTSQIPSVAGVYLPLSGGTLTGALIGTTATFNGNLNLQAGATRNINFYDSSNTNINAQIQYDQISSNSGQLFFGTNNAGSFATRLTIAPSGAATFSAGLTTGATINSGDSITMGGELYFGGITSNRKLRAYSTGTEGNATLNYAFWNGSTWPIVATLNASGAATFNSTVTASGVITGSTGVNIGANALGADRMFQVSGTSFTTGSSQFAAVLNPSFSGTITNVFGVYAGNNFGTGTITNSYNLYIEGTSLGSATVTNRWGIYQAGGTDRNYFAGNVLVGKTTNAGGKLQVSNGTITFNVDHNADGAYLTAATDNNVSYRRLSYDATDHVFLTSASERMRITAGGQLLVGATSTPGYIFSLQYNASAAAVMSIRNSSSTGYSGAHLLDNAGNLVAHFGYANSGIGGGLSDQVYFGSIASKAVVFTTNDSEKMRITSAGLVGINTSSPGHMFDVNGNGRFTGQLFVGAGTAATNVQLSLNGVSGKAQRIQFQNLGTDQWLLGAGAASETSAFELYNASGTIVMSVNKSTSTTTFDAAVKVKTLEVTNVGTDATSSGVSTYMRITVNGQNYLIPLHGTP